MSTEGLSVRRATKDDIPSIRMLMGAGGPGSSYTWEKRYGELNFSLLIETSYLTVVAISDEGNQVCGFASLNDSPNTTGMSSLVDSTQWETWVAERYTLSDAMPTLAPCNTLWLSVVLCDPANADGILSVMLKTVVTTLPFLKHVLFPLPSSVGLFAPLTGLFHRLPPAEGQGSQGVTLYYCFREDILPALVIRKGMVEDFDDLMPLLLAGEGVLTMPPEEFYLDETLENQDHNHSVLVAEDPETRQIVGLMCMSSSQEDQVYVVKHYATDVYNKLKPVQIGDGERQRHGVPPQQNSFQIDFFYLNPDFECSAMSFLKPAFAEFPYADYCFIYLPHSTSEHALLHEFAYIPLKQGLTLPNGLWLLSRYALDDLRVEKGRAAHHDVLSRMLLGQTELSREYSERMVDLAREGCESHEGDGQANAPLRTFALTHSGVPVGVCLLRQLSAEEVHHLRADFELEDIINFVPDGIPDYSATNIDPNWRYEYTSTMASGLVSHFYVRSIFRNYVRIFLREVMRQAGLQVLFHCLSLNDEVSQPLLAELILAMPRRMIDHTNLVADAPQEEEEELLCLHFTSKKQLSDEKTKIHSRLVVVGAGTTGLAAIYALLKIPYLYIPNIVLVSRDGIPEHPNVQEPECWGVDTLTWLEREYILFKIGHKVRIIEGTMIDFERNDKYIVTDNGFIEPYDHLIITAGRQYTIPKEMASKHLAKNGVFELSSAAQIHKIKQHIRESEAYEDELSNAVIYGSNMDAYCVATSLAHIGLNPSRIVVVSPEDTFGEEKSIFGDPLIDIKVDKLMESLGAKTYKHHVLERMDYDEDHNLNSVFIVPQVDAGTTGEGDARKKKPVEIPATMFIYCHEKDIDTQILSALNKRSIVFDGRVIVKYNYRTTDPSIYAVGPIAMFSGRFGPSEEFEKFNPLEVGERFSQTVLGFIGVEEFQQDDDDSDMKNGGKDDPLAAELGTTNVGEEKEKPALPKPLPKYESNITCRVQLPNNFHYFMCKTARFAEVASRCVHLTSSNARGDNYIRVSISPNKYIEAIMYFGSEDIEVHNLKTLVGLPESILNIMYAYEQSRNGREQPSLDILQHMRSQLTYALYYSSFPAFYNELREKIAKHVMTEKLREEVTQFVEENGVEAVTDEKRVEFARKVTGEDSDLRHVIELELIKYIHHNKQHFPNIYYLPDVTQYCPPVY